MASTVSNQTALPSELSFGLSPSLPSATSREIRVQPVNSQNFKASNVIQVDIPCKPNTYLDSSSTYIRYKITYSMVSGAIAAIDYGALISSAYSPYIKQEVFGNNSTNL